MFKCVFPKVVFFKHFVRLLLVTSRIFIIFRIWKTTKKRHFSAFHSTNYMYDLNFYNQRYRQLKKKIAGFAMSDIWRQTYGTSNLFFHSFFCWTRHKKPNLRSYTFVPSYVAHCDTYNLFFQLAISLVIKLHIIIEMEIWKVALFGGFFQIWKIIKIRKVMGAQIKRKTVFSALLG